MPIYDFECPHGHQFEHMCRMDDRLKEIPCEGTVNRLADDDIAEEALKLYKLWKEYPDTHPEEPRIVKGQEIKFEMLEGMAGEEPLVLTPVPCQLKAKLVVRAHAHPAGMLDHGLASNRDAAREGRYDPLNPNRRFMAKGRSWRK